MVNHPRRSRSRLAQYGARLRTIDGQRVVEIVDPNDNARRRFQYRRTDAGLQRRVLRADGTPMMDGSPWEDFSAEEIANLYRARGEYHPILDPLGLYHRSLTPPAGTSRGEVPTAARKRMED